MKPTKYTIIKINIRKSYTRMTKEQCIKINNVNKSARSSSSLYPFQCPVGNSHFPYLGGCETTYAAPPKLHVPTPRAFF